MRALIFHIRRAGVQHILAVLKLRYFSGRHESAEGNLAPNEFLAVVRTEVAGGSDTSSRSKRQSIAKSESAARFTTEQLTFFLIDSSFRAYSDHFVSSLEPRNRFLSTSRLEQPRLKRARLFVRALVPRLNAQRVVGSFPSAWSV